MITAGPRSSLLHQDDASSVDDDRDDYPCDSDDDISCDRFNPYGTKRSHTSSEAYHLPGEGGISMDGHGSDRSSAENWRDAGDKRTGTTDDDDVDEELTETLASSRNIDHYYNFYTMGRGSLDTSAVVMKFCVFLASHYAMDFWNHHQGEIVKQLLSSARKE